MDSPAKKNYKNDIRNSDLKEAFNVFDKDKDGFITVKELKAAMIALGYNLSNEELQNLVNKYDKDESGTVDLSEFMDLMTQKIKEQEDEKDILEIFESFDRDGDGLLSKDEIAMVLKEVGEEVNDDELNLFFDYADKDEDGHINYYEFSKIMKGK